MASSQHPINGLDPVLQVTRDQRRAAARIYNEIYGDTGHTARGPTPAQQRARMQDGYYNFPHSALSRAGRVKPGEIQFLDDPLQGRVKPMPGWVWWFIGGGIALAAYAVYLTWIWRVV